MLKKDTSWLHKPKINNKHPKFIISEAQIYVHNTIAIFCISLICTIHSNVLVHIFQYNANAMHTLCFINLLFYGDFLWSHVNF